VVPWWYSEMCGEAGYEFGGDWISISDFASRTYVSLWANRNTCQVSEQALETVLWACIFRGV